MSDQPVLLIIDDSEDDRLSYRRALKKITDTAFNILEADDGERGIQIMEQSEPACVLLDYSLPGRDGIEVLKRIRARHPFVPVVMLTGQGNEKVAVAAMREGAQNYINKSSITPETLEHVTRMAIEHCTMQKRIHEQRTSLEVFTRALAHDLKEPVRTIRSFAELITEYERFSPKAGEYFEHIRKAADRMAMLIDTVFLYTRLDDPGQMQREICDMSVMLSDAKENAGLLIKEHKAVIEGEALPQLYANRTQMTQLLQNLICNAIHHSERPVTVRVSAQEQENDWLFRVSDNGPGIDPSYFHKIFEPFKRLARNNERGAGLGLAICRKIIESHGGTIWCESAPGKGASFLFTLPKALPVLEQQRQEKAAEQPAVAPPARRKQPMLANILLVDDSSADVEITRFRLVERSHLQCNLLVAHDGDQALSMLRDTHSQQGPIDMVLLDINMPEMDGFELLQKIRSDPALKRVAVVMCTGSIYDKDMARAFALGAVGYITKPIEFSKLRPVIEMMSTVRLAEEKSGFSLLRAA